MAAATPARVMKDLSMLTDRLLKSDENDGQAELRETREGICSLRMVGA